MWAIWDGILIEKPNDIISRVFASYSEASDIDFGGFFSLIERINNSTHYLCCLCRRNTIKKVNFRWRFMHIVSISVFPFSLSFTAFASIKRQQKIVKINANQKRDNFRNFKNVDFRLFLPIFLAKREKNEREQISLNVCEFFFAVALWRSFLLDFVLRPQMCID